MSENALYKKLKDQLSRVRSKSKGRPVGCYRYWMGDNEYICVGYDTKVRSYPMLFITPSGLAWFCTNTYVTSISFRNTLEKLGFPWEFRYSICGASKSSKYIGKVFWDRGADKKVYKLDDDLRLQISDKDGGAFVVAGNLAEKRKTAKDYITNKEARKEYLAGLRAVRKVIGVMDAAGGFEHINSVSDNPYEYLLQSIIEKAPCEKLLGCIKRERRRSHTWPFGILTGLATFDALLDANNNRLKIRRELGVLEE
jgi:hypothetical protein